MINNLNLENIKVVIFDYDGTLAIHRDKDFVKGLSIMETATPKIRRRVKYGQPK